MCKIFFLLTLIFLLTANVLKAQSVSALMGARSTGLAYASTTLKDEWAIQNNIGGVANIDLVNIGFAASIHPSLEGSNRLAATSSFPTSLGAISLGVFRFGDNIYNEQIISIGYGHKLGLASLGLKANYVQYRAEGFGRQTALTLGFGGIADITPLLSIGAYVTNINQPRLGSGDTRVPTKLTAGLGFRPIKKVLILTEIEKDLELNPKWKTGIEYLIYQKLAVRTGFNLNPSTTFFGLGVESWKVKLDFATTFSRALKLSYQASASYSLSKSNKQ